MSETKRTSSFEMHMGMIGQSKTASAHLGSSDDLLTRLAQELGVSKTAADESGVAHMAPAATDANATPLMANPTTVSATEAIAAPQLALKGGDAAEVAAGEQIAGLAVAMPIISDGTGRPYPVSTLTKTEEAAEAAQRGVGGEQSGPLESAAVSQQTSAEAEKVGALIAKSFQETLQKQAEYQEYAAALQVLDSNGMLANYNITDVPAITKVASADCLEKIANNLPLTRQDIIGAAYEMIDLEKQAELAAEQGRADAQNLLTLIGAIQKTAAENEMEETEEEAKKKEEEAKKEGESEEQEKEENEKVSAMLGNKEVVSAVQILKKYNLL